MSEYKGVVIDHARTLMKKAGIPDSELAKRLSPADAELMYATTAMSWIPLSPGLRIIKAAAELVFPGKPRGIYELNRSTAQANITGIYRVLVKALTMQAVIERAAKLWSTYFTQGSARIVDQEPGRACLLVEGYPTLDRDELEGVEGFVYGVMETAGARNIRVVTDGSNPYAWRWHFSWN